MQQHKLPVEAPPQAGAWYRQPVLWLGAVILGASLAGCIFTIVLSSRHADVPLEAVHPHTLLDMPVHGAGKGEAGTGNAEPAHDPGATGGRAERTP